MDQYESVKRDERATELATFMLEQRDTMEEIVNETLTSAANGDIREAGRTLCPGSGEIRGALRRFPRAIDLATCPVDRGGTYHTHVTPREIRNPVNSLPDMANVVYGLTDVSVVVGTDTADVIVAAEDPDAGVREFQNAIGADVSGPTELSDAIRGGRINPSPARNRARSALDDLMFTAETGFSHYDEAVDTMPEANWAAPYGSGMDEEFSGNMAASTAFLPDSFEVASGMASGLISNTELRDRAISTAIGTVVGGVVSRVVFGE